MVDTNALAVLWVRSTFQQHCKLRTPIFNHFRLNLRTYPAHTSLWRLPVSRIEARIEAKCPGITLGTHSEQSRTGSGKFPSRFNRPNQARNYRIFNITAKFTGTLKWSKNPFRTTGKKPLALSTTLMGIALVDAGSLVRVWSGI
jgi:hypothetical protein